MLGTPGEDRKRTFQEDARMQESSKWESQRFGWFNELMARSLDLFQALGASLKRRVRVTRNWCPESPMTELDRWFQSENYFDKLAS
jgi:hypothetical protein